MFRKSIYKTRKIHILKRNKIKKLYFDKKKKPLKIKRRNSIIKYIIIFKKSIILQEITLNS